LSLPYTNAEVVVTTEIATITKIATTITTTNHTAGHMVISAMTNTPATTVTILLSALIKVVDIILEDSVDGRSQWVSFFGSGCIGEVMVWLVLLCQCCMGYGDGRKGCL
jgi:hypothetical protein